jgi:hypothetical protein
MDEAGRDERTTALVPSSAALRTPLLPSRFQKRREEAIELMAVLSPPHHNRSGRDA